MPATFTEKVHSVWKILAFTKPILQKIHYSKNPRKPPALSTEHSILNNLRISVVHLLDEGQTIGAVNLR